MFSISDLNPIPTEGEGDHSVTPPLPFFVITKKVLVRNCSETVLVIF